MQDILRILVSKNVQPQSFSLINGTVNDLIQYFGSSMTDKQESYLPILLYNRHDKVTRKKKDSPEHHTQAGNILGMTLEQFRVAHLDYRGAWVTDYVLANVASPHQSIVFACSDPVDSTYSMGGVIFTTVKLADKKATSLLSQTLSDVKKSLLVVYDDTGLLR